MDILAVNADNCNACGGKQWPHAHGQQVVGAKRCQGMPMAFPADAQGTIQRRKCMGLQGTSSEVAVEMDTPITKLCRACLMLTGGKFPQTCTLATMARLRDVKNGKFSGCCSCQ